MDTAATATHELFPEFKSENTGENPPAIENEGLIIDQLRNGIFSHSSRFDLKLEAHILQLAYSQNKFLSLSNSRTQILAHQVDSTHRIINAVNHRFMIADEVGLGKTIEAGLVMKELIIRKGYSRILVVSPASLLKQWQNEMRIKFNEHFTIMDRGMFMKSRRKKKGAHNPWEEHDKIICSIDFIKSPSQYEYVSKSKWDFIIFDEAHRLRRDSAKTTLAFNLARTLSEKTEALLLLTATPFRGKLEELYYLISLLDKNLLGPFQTFYNSYCLNDSNLQPLKNRLSKIIIRRTKKEVGGYTKRIAKTIKFELFPEERELYDAATSYVVEEFNRALEKENRATGFVMTVFQKLLDSSCAALTSALKRRKIRLEESLKRITEKDRNCPPDRGGRIKNFDLMQAERAELVEDYPEKDPRETKMEIETLERLIRLGEKVSRTKKGEKLLALVKKTCAAKKTKILIFTEFRTTQEYLRELLSDFSVEIFNGSMDRDQKEDAIDRFKNSSQVLISTEAGGEGRNLQFCNILINYDLPWSPLKIEQRVGRLHRFGQEKDVFIYNFSTRDTVAERVLAILTKKLKLFEESIGTPDILLGQIEEELNLNMLFMEMAKGKSARTVYSQLDKKIEAAKKSYEKLSDLAVLHKIDFNYDEYYRITKSEREYSNNRIEDFVEHLREVDDIVDSYLGKKHGINRLYPIRKIPGEETPSSKYGTFRSDKALENEKLEFLAFGNPIIDRLFRHCRESSFGGDTCIRKADLGIKLTALYCAYLVTYKSASESQKLIHILSEPGNRMAGERKAELENDYRRFYAITGEYKVQNAGVMKKFSENIDAYMKEAGERLRNKIESDCSGIRAGFDSSVMPEIDKITESYDKRIKECEEQLERQICQMKWFKRDMKSAITRSKGRLSKLKAEKQELLGRHWGYLDVDVRIELVSACVVVSGQ
jgi:superfamily II DNA or RNA helicase